MTPEELVKKRQNIMARARTLLALAEDPAATEAERDRARERAAKLILDHDLEDIHEASAEGHHASEFVERRWEVTGAFVDLKTDLAHIISEYVGGKGFYTSYFVPTYYWTAKDKDGDQGDYRQREDKTRQGWTVFATPAAAEFAELLFTAVLSQLERERAAASARGDSNPKRTGVSRHVWHRSFIDGWNHQIKRRLDTLKSKRVDSTPGALVLYKTIDDAFKEQHPDIETDDAQDRAIHLAAYAAGARRADHADLTGSLNNVTGAAATAAITS